MNTAIDIAKQCRRPFFDRGFVFLILLRCSGIQQPLKEPNFALVRTFNPGAIFHSYILLYFEMNIFGILG